MNTIYIMYIIRTNVIYDQMVKHLQKRSFLSLQLREAKRGSFLE